MAGNSDDVLIVGIDIGMTYTGIAHAQYCAGNKVLPPPNPITRWPSKAVSRVFHKAPTVLSIPNNHGLVKWGFESDEFDDRDPEYQSYRRYDKFKLLMDREQAPGAWGEGCAAENKHAGVRECYRVYLSEIYHLIFKTLVHTYRDTLGPSLFYSHRVEYIFSVPTTWQTQAITHFEEAIKLAGFGSIPSHTYHVGPGLTEADAAAIYSMEECPDPPNSDVVFETGDFLIVADLGGATTDIATVEVLSSPQEGRDYRLRHHGVVAGSLIGSTVIDELMLEYLLDGIPLDDPIRGKILTNMNLRKDIVSFKENFMEEVGQILPALHDELYMVLVIEPGQADPTFIGEIEHPRLNIINGRRSMPRSLIKWLFDLQLEGAPALAQVPGELHQHCSEGFLQKVKERIDIRACGIYELIDVQLEAIGDGNRERTFLSLTGGFSRSKYIQEQLRARYSPEHDPRVIRIHTPEHPQLAVCIGLVYMRLHQVMNDLPVLIRQSRASYGVVFDEPYDNTKHGPKDYVYTNPVDGQRYAKDQIHWIIAQESPLDGRPIAPFETFHVIKESDTVSWEIEIVKHTTSPGQRISLPARLVRDRTDPRAHEIDIVQRIPCKFSPTLEELNVIQKLKRFRLLKIKRYWKIPYEIRVDVGPAALNFQLWFNNKVRSSGDFIQNLMEDIRAQITSPA